MELAGWSRVYGNGGWRGGAEEAAGVGVAVKVKVVVMVNVAVVEAMTVVA